MAKPKPKDKIVRVNFTLPEILKKEWDVFSDETLHCSTSQMVRNAVRDYRLKFKELDQSQGDSSLQLMKMQVEQLLNQKMDEFKNTLQARPVNSNLVQVEEIKDSILSLLEKLQPLNTKDLSQYIRLTQEETLNVLAILQEKDKLVRKTKNGWMIVE